MTSEVLDEMQRKDESLKYAITACEIGNRAQYCAWLALRLLHENGETEAHRIAAKIATMPESASGDYDLACFYALTGDPTMAIEQLRSSLELGFIPQDVYKDEDLLSLHGNSQFEAYVEDVRKRTKQN